jgi:hypothetical protein
LWQAAALYELHHTHLRNKETTIYAIVSFYLWKTNKTSTQVPSVADAGCLSRILFFVHPGSRISDPGSKQQKRGVKKICCLTFFCSHKYHKIEIIFMFKLAKKNFWPNLQKIIELFTQKIVIKTSNYRLGIPDPGYGVKKASDPVSATQQTEAVNKH